MKLKRKFLLTFILIFLLSMTACVHREDKPKGTIQFTVTFPDGDYKACTIPDGTDRFSIFIKQIDSTVDPKHVEVAGEPGETKVVEVEIGVGNYKVTVFATKSLPYIYPENSVLAAGISNEVEVVANQVSETTIILEEVSWFDLVHPSEVSKDTVYTFSASVTRLFTESKVWGYYIQATAYDNQGDPIPDGYAQEIIPCNTSDEYFSAEADLRMPDVDATGTVEAFFYFGNAPFGYNLGVEHFTSPIMEMELVEDSTTGIKIIIQ